MKTGHRIFVATLSALYLVRFRDSLL